MDIKWKSTRDRLTPWIAFAAVFLGATLVLAGVLGMGKVLVSCDKDMEWWRADWQETTEFKKMISGYLQTFLVLAAGEEVLLWYDMNDLLEKEPLLPGSMEGYDRDGDTAAPEVSRPPEAYGSIVSDPSGAYPPEASRQPEVYAPDAAYQGDKNLLYTIFDHGYTKFTNIDAPLDAYYNFQLEFTGGMAYITKDRESLDVYNDDIYDSAEEWFVPGYNNFKAGEEIEGIRVHINVRSIPVHPYGEGRNSSHRVFDLYQEYTRCRETVFRLAVMLVVGGALLLLALPLRAERKKSKQRVAAVTAHVWTEVWVLLLLGFAAFHILLMEPGVWLSNILRLVFVENQYLALVTGLLLALRPTTPLLFFIYTLWLLRNDHRFNSRETRRGLLRQLRARDLKRPVEKRLRRATLGGLIAMAVVLLGSIPILLFCLHEIVYGWYDIGHFIIFALVLPVDVLFLLLAFPTWATLRTAKDIGLLTGQISAIHDGELSRRMELPGDADLHQAAAELDDIQSGLERALHARTQSERMKVELITNVSHDLKTPLTSILSYAALLEEEQLPGAAGDYARVILEKAQRLDGMVQDVFSISKAASGQLKLKPERLDLGKLLRQTLADMADAIGSSGLTVKTDIPDTPVEIEADGERLYRVFQNLIQNALQYSIPGSRVYLSLAAETDSALAAICNTSAHELSPGTDYAARFVRGDNSRTDGGAGLGLSIAASFTEACGGRFSVETLADLFTVKVSFPLAH